MSRVLLAVAYLLAVRVSDCRGQEIDTVLFEDLRTPIRILDQIEDPDERRSLEQLLAGGNAVDRLTEARNFLRRYPQSAFLSVALDVAARSAVVRDDPAAAIRYARVSLKLLPENPLLLVLSAELNADRGDWDATLQDSDQALRYLDMFARPASYSAQQWAPIASRARASALRSKARVFVAKAQAQEEGRDRRLSEATRLLEEAVAADPGDADARYWLERILAATNRVPTPRDAPGGSPAADPQVARYAGTARCAGCHAGQHKSWSQTGMAKMFRPIQPETVIGEFPAELSVNGKTAVRMFERSGKRFFAFPKGEQWVEFEAHFTIGSKWQQAYATRLPDGRIEVFPVQYNRLEKRWLNFWELIDPPGSSRTVVERFTKFDGATTYQKHCAPCHTSQLRMTDLDSGSPADVLFREPGVNCEMCHGPSEQHAASREAGRTPPRQPADPPVDFRKLDAPAYVGICAQCHRQSSIFRQGPRGEMNYSGKQQDFLSRASSRPFLEFSRKAFYRDGRFRESTFIVESLERSRCFQVGGTHCGHCHDPHPEKPETNPTSLKYPDDPDRMCLPCHSSVGDDIAGHTHQKVDSSGSRCVNCHMPKLMNSLLFRARTHTIDDIPDPALTLRFGQRESPNACLECHAQKNPGWVREVSERWWGWKGTAIE